MAKWWTLLVIVCLSVLLVPNKSEEHHDVLADLELVDLEPLDSGPKDSTQAEISLVKQLSSPPQAQPLQSSSTVKDKDDSSVDSKFKTDQHDEPSEPVKPDSVEIKSSDINWNGEEEPKNDNTIIDGNNSATTGHAGTSVDSHSKTFNEDENDEDDRSYGNPPVLSDSDKLDFTQKIPADLSEEEREEWHQNISESLGLSALDPGLAMLPVGQNVHSATSGTRQTSTVAAATTTTVATTSESESNEAKKSPERGSEENRDPKQINTDNSYDYEEDDSDDWYYDPEDMTVTTTNPKHRVPSQNEDAEDDEDKDAPSEARTQIGAPEFKEGVVSKEDIHTKKVLQAPKGTIILYTALIVILIACIVLFSMWKNPFKNGRPGHQPSSVRTAEEGKRLLDHPFV